MESTKKVKIISATNAEKNAQFGDTWVLKLDAGKGPFDAWYQGKKDLTPLVGKEEEVVLENKAHFSNKALVFRMKFPGGNKGFGNKAYNPSPEQQIRIAALNVAIQIAPADQSTTSLIDTAKEYEKYITHGKV